MAISRSFFYFLTACILYFGPLVLARQNALLGPGASSLFITAIQDSCVYAVLQESFGQQSHGPVFTTADISRHFTCVHYFTVFHQQGVDLHAINSSASTFIMATIQIGCVGEYEPEREKLSSYLDRLEGYFSSNKIGKLEEGADAAAQKVADLEKVNALIAMGGAKLYGVMSNAMKPDKPKTKTFDDLTGVLRNHYVRSKIEVAETFKFHHVFQVERSPLPNLLVVYVSRPLHVIMDSSLDGLSRTSLLLVSMTQKYKKISCKRLEILKNVFKWLLQLRLLRFSQSR